MGGAGMVGSYHEASFTGRVSPNTPIMTMGWTMLAVGVLLLVETFRRLHGILVLRHWRRGNTALYRVPPRV